VGVRRGPLSRKSNSNLLICLSFILYLSSCFCHPIYFHLLLQTSCCIRSLFIISSHYRPFSVVYGSLENSASSTYFKHYECVSNNEHVCFVFFTHQMLTISSQGFLVNQVLIFGRKHYTGQNWMTNLPAQTHPTHFFSSLSSIFPIHDFSLH